MTYEVMVEQCKQLRARHEQAEAEFFGFLATCERDHEAVWTGAGCATFDQFLRSNQLCKPERYTLWKAGVERVGVEAAMNYGAAFTIEAAKFDAPDQSTIQAFVARADAFRQVNHTAPSAESARVWRAEIGGRSKPSETEARASELVRLRADNHALRERVSQLEAEVAALRLQMRGVTSAEQKGRRKAA